MVLFNYPKVDLYGNCMELFYVMGVIPELPDGSNKSSLIYKLYAFLMYYSGLLFNMFEFMNLIQTIIKHERSLEIMITNYMLASLHLSGLLKSGLCKSKKGAKYMKKIIDFEKKIQESDDKKLMVLYKRNCSAFRTTAAGYFVCVFMIVVCYGSSSLLRPKQYVTVGNITYEAKQLPIQIWSPFNPFTQFGLAYLWAISIGAQLAFYFVAGDLVIFGYTIFALCKIDMLKHFIENFFKKAEEIRNHLKCDEAESYRILQRECIILHQDIISYMKILNSHIKYIMFMDFLPGSIQMAALMYQVMKNLNLVQVVLIGEFLLTLVTRFLIYCLNANKIHEQSQLIGTIWYQIDWTVLPEDVKKNMIICINRSHKPLSITIGDFQNISLVTFVANCPKINLFGRCVELFCLMGIMPDLPDGSNKSGWLYKIFSFLMYYSGCLFNMFEFVNLLQILLSKKEGTLEMAITNYMLASLHLTGLLKCPLSKGKIGAKYMQKVVNFERKVYVSENKELITIYENNSKDFRKTAAGYFIGVFMVIVCYGSSSLIRSKQYVMIANITYETNQVPLQIWSPFNQYTQFILTYLWCVLIGAQLAFFFVAGDLVCFGYSIFALCRLKVLKYFIMSFFEKAKEIRHQLNCDETESYRILQRECIIMHQEIISFVDSLNSHIKYIMLMDFLPGSIQLAALLYQLINNLNMIQMVLIGEFLLTLTARFFIYCLNANKINEQSQMIGTVWYQIDWTVLPEDLKKNIFICVNRTQKPLSISMGDFQDISLVTFVSIMKGAYTYMMFLTTF